MFSLIAFHNGTHSVVPSKNVQELKRRMCIVKYHGAKYSAFFIKKSDDKSYLQQIKNQKETSCKPSKAKAMCGEMPYKNSSPFLPLLKTKSKEIFSNECKTDGDQPSKESSFVSLCECSEKPSNLSSTSYTTEDSFASTSGAKNSYAAIPTHEMTEIGEFPNADCVRPQTTTPDNSSKCNNDQNKTRQSSNNVVIFEGNEIPNNLSSDNIDQESHIFKSRVKTFSTPIAKDNEISTTPNAISTQRQKPISETGLHNESFQIEPVNIASKGAERNERSFPLSENSAINENNSTILSEIQTSKENVSDFTSVNLGESTISEYIVDSSIDASRDLENSKRVSENNRSVDIIETPVDVTKIIVPSTRPEYKKHFCVFCHTLQCKISRHIFLKHKNEPLVKQASLLPTKSAERLKIIAEIRKRGDFIHNTSAEFNSGILIVPRRQQTKFKNSADDYICCKKCKGFFSKRTLRIHVAKCTSSKNSRTNFIESRRLTQFIHPVANSILKSRVFPTLRNDNITKAIRYDELAIKLGNKLTEKYSAQHLYDMIRANLRLLGRFKIQMNKLEPAVKELKQIFHPKYFDKCIEAVRATAHWDDEIMGFKTPAVAQNITSLIKKCAKKQRAELIKEQNEESKVHLENFLLLWEEETPTLINRKALEDQTNQKRIKKVIVPTKEDINKLYLYLKTLINKSVKTLETGFCLTAWTELVKSTLILIQIFNRRRAGEIERLTIENFSVKESITDTVDKDVLKHLSSQAIRFAKQYVKINLRGKLGRTVAILLCPMSINAVEMILKYRSEAGINELNNFIFSKPTTSKLAKQYYRACPLLRKFSQECGAQIPESLRGTNLRKQIATYTSLLNVEEAAVDKLANFMGHHKDIHKNIYRVSVPAAEITCIAKLLMAAITDGEEVEDHNDTDVSDDREDEEDKCQYENVKNINSPKSHPLPADSFEEVNEKNLLSQKKRRSTSPFGKTKRFRWTEIEKNAIYSIFGNIQQLEKLPTLNECLDAISQHQALRKRTPQQVKSWIDNQRRLQKPDDSPSNT